MRLIGPRLIRLILLDETSPTWQIIGMARKFAHPILISRTNARCELQRVHLGAGIHDEKWLQALIHDHPAILPIADIEPGFGDLIPTAREVPCGHGFIDNLYLTPAGGIVLVETKLWRNSQMRREVVAQVLDYVAALSGMSYDSFESAIQRGMHAPEQIYDLVREHPEALEEAAFIDAVANNLGRGRVLAIALGDGIRTETEVLAQLLQSHAGAHFTFALVELSVWENAGDLLVVPGTLARTVMIERGIVRVEQGAVSVHPVPREEQLGPQSITSADYWEQIAQIDPALPSAIRAFLDELETLSVYTELGSSLTLKVDVPYQDKTINLGSIRKDGSITTEVIPAQIPEQFWKPYCAALSHLVDGEIRDTGRSIFIVDAAGKKPKIQQLLPRHRMAWVAAIEELIRALQVDAA